mgnify:CR=1 FL=1
MLTSSGQAASFFAFFNICEAGDHIVSATSIYGGTYNLLAVTLKKLGIDCTFIDQDASEEEISKAFRPNTKAMFGEMISNPGVMVLDVEKFARIAHNHGVPLIVDNTSPRRSIAVRSNGERISLRTPRLNIWMAMPRAWVVVSWTAAISIGSACREVPGTLPTGPFLPRIDLYQGIREISVHHESD